MAFDPTQLLQSAPQAAKILMAEAARRSLKEFTKQAWPILEPGRAFVDGWYIGAMCEHLQAVDEGEIKRLVITVSPGAMKSRLTRVNFPLWRWTRSPHLKFLGGSYALALAERDNYYARLILQSQWYQDSFGVKISADQGAKVNFDNEQMGGMRAISVGGATTGFRGDCNILDDAHNASEGESDAKRSEAVQWFLETFQTRVNDLNTSPIIVIGQRIHEEDVPGVAIEMGYEHLNIPMEWDETYRKPTSIGWTDPRTKEGELMAPDRFSAEAVDRLKKALGPYAAAAQLQQHPVPRKGGLFQVDAIEQIDELPDEPFLFVRAWDLAGTQGGGAYTAGVKLAFGRKSERFYIVDVRRKQVSHAGVKQMIEDAAEDDGIETQIILPQDPGAAGRAVADDLVAMLAGYNVKVEPQSGDKETRAKPFASQVERGHVAILKRVWTKPFLDEVRFFPKGKYKDMADAASSAFNALAPLARKKKKVMSLVLDGEKSPNLARVS
jgi:predicted phage terminase large subunit-like protein